MLAGGSDAHTTVSNARVRPEQITSKKATRWRQKGQDSLTARTLMCTPNKSYADHPTNDWDQHPPKKNQEGADPPS